jgi:hypothetical protein
MNKSRVITVGSAAAVLAMVAGGASAASLITSKDIQDGAVHKIDLSPGANRALDKAGQPALTGAVYRIAHYSGGANGGAIATVACADTENKSQKYVAISGGVQILNADGDLDATNDSNVAVADSFPGRMDWSTNSPKANRLDGWVVRFGDDSKAATQVNIWAVCMPAPADLQVQTTDY